MLTVVTPATSTRLTTLSRARGMLGFGAADDVAADQCIDQASAAIVDHCRRPFALETVEETFGGIADGGVLLARSPVTAFVAVTHDDAALLTSEYAYDPQLGRLYRSDAAGQLWRWWGALTVRYTAGFTLPDDTGTWTLPGTVERAAILIAGAYLSGRSRDPLLKSESVEGVGSTSWWVPGPSGLISPEAEQLLQPFRRFS